jgi:SAM-dependent methyltransferase
MADVVGAEHAFHDADFVRGWAARFVPTPPRLALFDMILNEVLVRGGPAAHVVELGIGPGYLARHILERADRLTYEGVDFSAPMAAIARETLGVLAARVTFTTADLLDQTWPRALSRRPDAIVSTWSLHDLGSEAAVANVYARCFETLADGGVLLNGDFIKPDGTPHAFEPGRFPIARHLSLLTAAGFADPRCLAHLEPNVETPTPAENYACFVAVR